MNLLHFARLAVQHLFHPSVHLLSLPILHSVLQGTGAYPSRLWANVGYTHLVAPRSHLQTFLSYKIANGACLWEEAGVSVENTDTKNVQTLQRNVLGISLATFLL